MWTILGTFPSMNGQFKVIARRGSAVAHIDRLTAEQAASIDSDAVQAFWSGHSVRPPAGKCGVSA